MVGAGVFLSAGYMAQEMSAGLILLAWLVGAVLAMAGARAYAEVAQLIPRSGGEYRYLGELFHPGLGYVAGVVTVVIGFAQPTAINALAATSFAGTLLPELDSKLLAAGLIASLALVHAVDMESSKLSQNLLVLVKVTLLAGFVLLGLLAGSHEWPSWKPPHPSESFGTFVGSLLFISYAFSGWNTAAYASEEFEHPKRDVARAMIIGCSLIALLYLVINWIFVANLTPQTAAVVMDYENTRATLGHAVVQELIGETGGRLMSVLAILSFLSAMSAMLMIGPRITAQMAADGYLPRFLARTHSGVPGSAIALQAAIAILVLTLHSLQEALEGVGATLVLFVALTALGLLLRSRRTPISLLGRLSALLYFLAAMVLLYLALSDKLHLIPWIGGVIGVAFLVYHVTERANHAR
jgi:APA family basic amino acid/polyamine antiporter